MAFKREVIGLRDLEQNLKRLAKLVPGGEIVDSLEDGAWVIALGARDNAVAQGLIESGALVDSIRPRKINQFRVDVEVGVVYGAAHEFGVTVTITERQRRFFWAKFAETSDEKWRALALSVDYTIPMKPYLRPAVDTEKKAAVKRAGRSLAVKIDEAIK